MNGCNNQGCQEEFQLWLISSGQLAIVLGKRTEPVQPSILHTMPLRDINHHIV